MNRKQKIISVGIALVIIAILLIGIVIFSNIYSKKSVAQSEKFENSFVFYNPSNSQNNVFVPWNVKVPVNSCQKNR